MALSGVNKRLSWMGNSLLLVAAIALSVSPRVAAGWQVYLVFALGHVLWITVSLRRKDNALLVLNSGLMMLDFYAVFIRYPGVTYGAGLA